MKAPTILRFPSVASNISSAWSLEASDLYTTYPACYRRSIRCFPPRYKKARRHGLHRFDLHIAAAGRKTCSLHCSSTHFSETSEIAAFKSLIKEIKKYKDIPLFLHTDGDINSMMDSIAGCGFDGLHSLQPSAGMDIAKVKKEYGSSLCLMGNIDLDYIMTFGTPEEVRKTVKWTMDAAAPGGGFILGTCNILFDAIPEENAMAMYRTAEEHGWYK